MAANDYFQFIQRNTLNTLRFRRPHSASTEPAIFPPTIYTTATYSRGILIPNPPTNNAAVIDCNNLEEVSIPIPSDYFQSSHALPALTAEQSINWNHGIAAHAASRRRPPMDIGWLLGTITLYFEDSTTKKCHSLYHLADSYYAKHKIQRRTPNKKDGEKHKTLTLKQALVEVRHLILLCALIFLDYCVHI
jgi:hypothetical protein